MSEANDTPVEVHNTLSVVFSHDAWLKINGYIKGVQNEVSGLGRATIEQNRIYITDIYLWEQENTSAHTQVATTGGQQNGAVHDLVAELMKEKVPTKELCVWWHSHYNFDSFFSGTDHATIENWLTDGLLCAVVGNQAGSFKSIVALKKPIAVKVACPVLYEQPRNEAIEKEVADNIKTKIKTVTVPDYSYDRYQGTMFSDPYKTSMGEYDYNDAEAWEYAEDCLCDHCHDFISGLRATFLLDAHYWKADEKRYVPKGKKQQAKSWKRLTAKYEVDTPTIPKYTGRLSAH